MKGRGMQSATSNRIEDQGAHGSADSTPDDTESPSASTESNSPGGAGAFSRAVRVVVGVSGVALIGFAALLLFAPQQVESIIPITEIARSPAIADEMMRSGLFALLGVGCTLWILLTRPAWADGQSEPSRPDDEHPPSFGTLRTNPPEEADTTPVVGASFDDRVETVVDATGRSKTDSIRTELRSLTADALVTVDGLSPEEAQTRLDDGTWTDDIVAAAYLADREATLSLRHRLLAWLRPAQTKRRRIERTTSVIAARFDTESDQLPTGDRT